jgi:hypothetical protein
MLGIHLRTDSAQLDEGFASARIPAGTGSNVGWQTRDSPRVQKTLVSVTLGCIHHTLAPWILPVGGILAGVGPARSQDAVGVTRAFTGA